MEESYELELESTRRTRVIQERITPKLPYEMSRKELSERLEAVNARMVKAVHNYEFIYYEELKAERAELKKEIKKRKGVIA